MISGGRTTSLNASMPAATQARLTKESGVKRELLLQRVRHFTQGVIIGSRGFIDEWFERNRNWFRGKSQTERKTGVYDAHSRVTEQTGSADYPIRYTYESTDGWMTHKKTCRESTRAEPRLTGQPTAPPLS